MPDPVANFVDRRAHAERDNDRWPVHVFRGAEIAAQLEELERGAPGSDGRREASAVHPRSTAPGLGITPGIEALFGVLLPGEQTRPRRHNASQVTMVTAGRGTAEVAGRLLSLAERDVYNTPSMSVESLLNDGDEPLRYVTFTSAPMLRKLEVYWSQLDPPLEEYRAAAKAQAEYSGKIGRARDLAGGPVPIGDGAMLLPYEHLVDPEWTPNQPLLWAWDEVAPHLGLVRTLDKTYTGRPLWCLYNPATEKRNGTTHCFFASITAAGPNLGGQGHRHTSAAINFVLDGSGSSDVEGEHVTWEAGDIMLSAPGWSPHGHATGPDGAVILTIQDHPLQIGAEALVWEEQGVLMALGSQAGYETNLAAVRG